MKPPYRFEISHDRERTAVFVNGESLLEVDNSILNVPFRWWRPATWKYRIHGARLEFWTDPTTDAIFNVTADAGRPQ